MKVQDYYFSVNTTFHWRETSGKSDVLVSETNIPEAFYILQLYQRNECTHVMKFKPLVSVPMTDLIGQKRAKAAFVRLQYIRIMTSPSLLPPPREE